MLGGFDDEEEDEDMVDEPMVPASVNGGVMGEEGQEDVMAVQGDDGQHYVVLEVIQMGDNAAAAGATRATRRCPALRTRDSTATTPSATITTLTARTARIMGTRTARTVMGSARTTYGSE